MSTESVFRAVAHESRRRILEILAKREMSATDIARQFEHTQPTLSNHLQILLKCGLVSCKRQGARLIYRLEPNGLGTLRRWIERMSTGGRK